MTYNGFEYNKFGVCINSEIPYKFGNYKDDSFVISVSQTPSGWVFGWQWNTLNSGGGSPCSPNHRDVFPTKQDAIVKAASDIRIEFAKRSRNKAVAELDRIISEESKPKIRQMTIFDYL